MIKAIGVVVPAHNEESTLARCLQSVARSAAHPRLAGIPIRVVAVLDDCWDDSGDEVQRVALEVRRQPPPALDVAAVEQAGAANVGAARAAGCRHVLNAFAGVDPRQVWMAPTDADSLVPADWLAHHMALQQHGADACAGMVRVADWGQQPAEAACHFARLYPLSDPPGVGTSRSTRGTRHSHVHGANMGFTADAYQRAGGFPSRSCGEDHALHGAMHQQGLTVMGTIGAAVITSARRESRVTGGFSDTLRNLGSHANAAYGKRQK